MTPFGVLMRHWRASKQATLAQLADYLAVSPAYLSALEHGKRGKPSFAMVDQICVYFELIWDDAEALKTSKDNYRIQNQPSIHLTLGLKLSGSPMGYPKI